MFLHDKICLGCMPRYFANRENTCLIERGSHITANLVRIIRDTLCPDACIQFLLRHMGFELSRNIHKVVKNKISKKHFDCVIWRYHSCMYTRQKEKRHADTRVFLSMIHLFKIVFKIGNLEAKLIESIILVIMYCFIDFFWY